MSMRKEEDAHANEPSGLTPKEHAVINALVNQRGGQNKAMQPRCT